MFIFASANPILCDYEIDLPSLLSFIISPYSFTGDASKNRRTITNEPYNYKNVLIMEGRADTLEVVVVVMS